MWVVKMGMEVEKADEENEGKNKAKVGGSAILILFFGKLYMLSGQLVC